MTIGRERHAVRQRNVGHARKSRVCAAIALCALVAGAAMSCTQQVPHRELPERATDTANAASPQHVDHPVEHPLDHPAEQPITRAASAPSQLDAPASQFIACTPLVRVDPQARVVAFDATSVLDTGFLEQFVCLKETREHESLFVFEGQARDVHAALLLAGAIPGSPGRWREVETKAGDGTFAIEGVAPEGTELEITVQLPSGVSHPLAWFVREAPIAGNGDRTPPSRFVFGGSRFVAEKARDGRPTGRERYLADSSGSLVGLVTFGDETIGAAEVIPDQASVAQPMWEAHTERMPKPGTKVTVFLRVVTPK